MIAAAAGQQSARTADSQQQRTLANAAVSLRGKNYDDDHDRRDEDEDEDEDDDIDLPDYTHWTMPVAAATTGPSASTAAVGMRSSRETNPFRSLVQKMEIGSRRAAELRDRTENSDDDGGDGFNDLPDWTHWQPPPAAASNANPVPKAGTAFAAAAQSSNGNGDSNDRGKKGGGQTATALPEKDHRVVSAPAFLSPRFGKTISELFQMSLTEKQAKAMPEDRVAALSILSPPERRPREKTQRLQRRFGSDDHAALERQGAAAGSEESRGSGRSRDRNDKNDRDDESVDVDFSNWDYPGGAMKGTQYQNLPGELADLLRAEAAARASRGSADADLSSSSSLPYEAWRRRHFEGSGFSARQGDGTPSAADMSSTARNRRDRHYESAREYLQALQNQQQAGDATDAEESRRRKELMALGFDSSLRNRIRSREDHQRLLRWLFPLCDVDTHKP